MSAQAADKKLFVDDVVTALTGTVDASMNSRGVIEDQMKRATEDFDLRTAEAFARALLEALCQEQIDPRRLEALLILGLAHPTILERHRISLEKEGQRLAAMLNAQGQHERARTLLEVISAAPAQSPDAEVEELPAAPLPSPKLVERDHQKIESLLRKADDAAARGRTGRAIHLLQEVVSLDRHRRDVARMIRDLRWQEQDRRVRSIRRLKLAAFVLALGGAIAGLVWRENEVQKAFAAIPPAKSGDLRAMRDRLAAIDEMIAEERVWLGMAGALTERTDLQREVSDLEMRAAAKKSAIVQEQTRTSDLADDARTRGMLFAKQGRFGEALADLRRSLELAAPDWKHKKDVESNVAAIADWIEKHPEQEGHGR